MNVLVITHKREKDIGTLDKTLMDRGYTVERKLAYRDDLEGLDPSEHDLTIFMGGPFGVYQNDLFPYIDTEVKYLEKRLAHDLPTLGVCLGAQLMAKALGANVYKGEQGKEIGWHSISVNEEGQKTALKHIDASLTPMMQWHGDTFDLPADATLLASNDLYQNQAFSYGKNAMAVQCHPEVDREITELWFTMGVKELQEVDKSVLDVRKNSADNLPILEKQTALFFNEWLDRVLGKMA